MRRNYVPFMAGIIVGGVLFSGGAALAAGLMAEPSSQTFYVDGKLTQLEAYSIGGYNYVKLGDLSPLVGFDLAYDGATNSVYIGERPVIPGNVEDGFLTNGKPVTEENVLELLRQIEQDWPTGTAWGTQSTPGTHKNTTPSTESGRIMKSYHVSNVYGCGAYASMVSSLIFGDTANPGRKLDDLSHIRPGDIVFLVSPEGKVGHVVIALESPNQDERFHRTEGNIGGTIQWPDIEDLRSYSLSGFTGISPRHLEVWSRYPESVPYTGDSVEVWP